MVVRVKVRLKTVKGKGEKAMEVVALLNAGYESETSEAILLVGVAERFNLWPKVPEGTEIGTIEVAGGGRMRTYFIEDSLEVQVITEERISNPIRATAVMMEGEKEIMLSDKSISKLEIVLEDVGRGTWRFKSEEKMRSSEIPQYW